jgi:S1-C subfamily serine protease
MEESAKAANKKLDFRVFFMYYIIYMKHIIISTIAVLLSASLCYSQARALPNKKDVAQFLQDVSVTIKSESENSKSEGSGVLINRKIGAEQVAFVWTCAHVIDNLRNIRNVVNEKGGSVKIVEFDDPQIIKELVEGGRRVGEIKMDAKVIKYSDYEHGHDLALLMVRARDYSKASAKFYLSKEDSIIPIGTRLFHVGSLLGQMGANSMTTGIISQIGRVEDKVEFDQTTVTAFPGSSGGGVYLEDGRYVGMIARGAGEGFNLMIPIRRIKNWAKENNVLWAIDPTAKTPPVKEILSMSIESSGLKTAETKKSKNKKRMNFLIRTTKYESQSIQTQ